MTDAERIAQLEAAVLDLAARLDPQTLRDALERTWDPRGGEPRIVDSAGRTLDYVPSLQLMGGSTTVDTLTQRAVFTPDGGGGGAFPDGGTPRFWTDHVTNPQILGLRTPWGTRLIMPYDGTVTAMWYCNSNLTAAGNVKGALYTFDGTGQRVLAAQTASAANVGNNTWANCGNPGLAVTAGQQLDAVLMADAINAQKPFAFTMSSIVQPIPFGLWGSPDGVTLSKIAFQYPAQGTFTFPATVPEASVTADNNGIAIYLVITP